MSNVPFSPIQPGDAASITAPNATMATTATATAAVNAENVRPEGIDERNLVFPLISTVSYNSGDWARTLKIPLNAWRKVDGGSIWGGGTGSPPTFSSGVPMSVTLGTGFSYAVIRYSFAIRIEGRVGGSNEDVGFMIFANGVPLLATERNIQNSISHGAAATISGVCRSVESVTLIHYFSVNTTIEFDLRFFINTHGQGPLAADHTNIDWVSTVEDAVTISRLTASVIKYK